MIPKVVHYIWFGDPNKKPLDKINNWKQTLSGFAIKEWSEKDFNIESYKFAKQAYDLGKYGMSIDPFRLEILEQHGGIWLDTDVNLYKNLIDFTKYSFFIGYALPGYFNMGLIGAAPHHPIITRTLAWYKENWSREIKVPMSLDALYVQLFNIEYSFVRTMKIEYGFMPDGESKTFHTKDGDIRIESVSTFTYGHNFAEHKYEGSWRTEKLDYIAMLEKAYGKY
jgi:hypothetical protein